MLVKSITNKGVTVEMFKNEMIFGEAYTVVCEAFIKSYNSLQEANKVFESLAVNGGLWH